MRISCFRRTISNHQLLMQNVRSFASGINTSDENEKPIKFAQTKVDRVFSGIQPTGVPHLGNYVGAIKNWVQLQKQYESVIISIVDLHSISITQDPNVLRENIFEMAACLIACGIDPDRTILFQQSTMSSASVSEVFGVVCMREKVPGHTYLSWILGCLCTLPRLSHLPQWKDKSQKVKDPGLGLFTYPVLQAADILLYKSTLVPVGEDQVTHLELARDLARAFNRNHGVLFPECKPLIGEQTKLFSLRQPTSKMSKSEDNSLGRIDLNDSSDAIDEKIRKAVTDSERVLTYDRQTRPGLANLFDIHSAISGVSQEELVNQYSDLNKVQYKTLLADVINQHIQPIRNEMKKLLDDRHELSKILNKGYEQASTIAEDTLKEVNQLVGFR